MRVAVNDSRDSVRFQPVGKLDPGKEMVFEILAKVTGEKPRLATCKVAITHDGLTDTFEDMAGVKVTTGRRAAAESGKE